MNEKTNLESISLIWLDDTANTTEDNRNLQEKLRSILSQLKIFDNCQQCEQFIREEIDEKFLLIVNGRLGQEFLERIHQLPQIISIFVFCMNKEKNQLWAKNYKKIRNVIVHTKDLLEQIENDRKNDEQKLNESFDVLSHDNDHLLSQILQIKYTIMDRREFLNICYKFCYEHSVRQFDHFYLLTNALKEFVQQTFLYRLLIKSLRKFHTEILYLLRFYIQDIEEQLKSCSICSTSVYSAHLMTKKQIDKLENLIHKQSIRFNSYLIAKKDQNQLVKSLENSTNKEHFYSVLFQIQSNQIGKQYEDLIIFPLTTQFSILSMEYQNQIYFVNLHVSISNETNVQPMKFVFHLKKLGRFDEAEQILHHLLKQYPRKSSEICQELAQIYQYKCLYDKSLEFYERSLLTISSKDRPNCLNNLGCIYDYLQQYDLALDFYSVSLNLMTNDLNRAMCLNNIAITLANQNLFSESLKTFEQSLEIQKQYQPESDLDIGISYANLGTICLSINQLDLALDYYQKALKIFRHYSSPLCQAITYQNLAEIFCEKNQFTNALEFYQKSIAIFRKIRPENHPTMIYIEQTIQQLIQTIK